MKKTDIKALRGIGHHLEPVVTIGANGISDAIIAEINRALSDHELIKVKIPAADNKSRQILCQQIASMSDSALIDHIRRTALLYKANPNANPKLSNLARFG